MIGQIELVVGPMFSGKSTELLRRMRRLEVAKKKCLYIKYKQDTRYSKDCIATHNNETRKAAPCDKLTEIDNLEDFECIGVDEGQFFPDLIEFCEKAANKGKLVIVAALDGTFERKPFGQICELIPLCESVTKLRAICMECQAEASFSKKISKDNKNLIDIGGSDKYISVCRECYNK